MSETEAKSESVGAMDGAALIRQLAATLNHEINNPLFVVSATLEDLLAESKSPIERLRLEQALECVWRAAKAVKSL
ncbi:MAG: histidine kinase dimerization/phospho-acceptor domain-containing protein, partial [Chthonomonadales bacterium]